MKLTLENLRVTVEADETEQAWLVEYLAFEDERLRYVRRRRGRPAPAADTFVRMFNRVTQTFPAGYTAMVVKAGRTAGLTVTVDDKRVRPAAFDPSADIAWLRDYQRDGVDRVVRRTRGLLWLPTGAGKTEIACALVRAIPCNWVFLVHRAGLVDQAAKRYELRTGDAPGRVGEGEWTTDRYTVATFQSVMAALKGSPERVRAAHELLLGAEGLIVDEAHTLAADTFWRVAMLTPNAYYRVGMSGTPLARGDKRSILTVGALGPVIYRIRPQVLIDAGVLAVPNIHMVAVDCPSNAPTFQGVYGEGIVRNAQRNKAVVAAAKAAPKPALVFVKEVKHGKALLERLSKAGVSAEFVWGNKNTRVRDAAVRRLVHGDIDVLVCSVIFQEGVDIPSLRSVVIASGGKSIIATLQRIGRGMRVTKGKGTFDVWDFDDRGTRMLERHARERRKAYEREGFTVDVKD